MTKDQQISRRLAQAQEDAWVPERHPIETPAFRGVVIIGLAIGYAIGFLIGFLLAVGRV